MKKAIFLAIAILLVGSTIAQATCSTPPSGDVAFRFGWGMTYAGWTTLPGVPYAPPPGVYRTVAVNGPDTTWGVPGAPLVFRLGPYNATAWQPLLCVLQDTMCFDVASQHGWTIVSSPVTGTGEILPPGGYFWTQYVTINIPCSATIGSYERVIAAVLYTNWAGTCDPSCPDCADPNTRPANNTKFYSKDTLYVHVLPAPPPPAPTILQDSLTLVEQGQTQAYIPFSLCNGDQCFAYDIGYRITSTGHFGGTTSWTGTVNVPGGKCSDVYAIINAGSLTPCQYDTLTTICWTVVAVPLYDTCVQVIHVVEARTVPLFTVPVVTILVLALILAAAVFMRRRAVSKA